MLWTDKAKKYLLKYWNISELKDKQIQVINELLCNNDVIGLLPTGYGKSLCYIIPPLVTKKIMFIISPLISLMNEQKTKLVNVNIPCAALHSNNTNRNEEIDEIINGNIKIVYMSPEYLISNGLEMAQQLIEMNKLGFLAVDEAHCISGWGHDFRPEYKNINKFRKLFPTIPIIAVTATATKVVCDDIKKTLRLNDPNIVKASFDRPNLSINIQNIPITINLKNKKKEKPVAKELIIAEHMKKHCDEKIIIYINSRKDTEEVASKLNKINKNCCSAYHAGMSSKTRDLIQNNFINGDIKVIISTTAFGMGIDQIVKCVLIFGSPSSIEEYYQQIGRGGRDGLPCETILYFEYSKFKIAQFMERKNPSQQKKDNLNKIKNLVFVDTCRRKYILEYFNEKCSFDACDNCDNCLKLKNRPVEVIKKDKFEEIIKKGEQYLCI